MRIKIRIGGALLASERSGGFPAALLSGVSCYKQICRERKFSLYLLGGIKRIISSAAVSVIPRESIDLLGRREEMEFVWIRYDMRIHDHQPLTEALDSGKRVMAGYVFDQKNELLTAQGFPRMDKKRRRFLTESLLNLHCELEKLGVPLMIAHGNTACEIKKWVQQYQLSHIRAFHYPGVEEADEAEAVRRAVEQSGGMMTFYEGDTLFHKEDVPKGNKKHPGSFSAYRKKIEKNRLLPRQEAELPQKQPPLYPEIHAAAGEELKKRLRAIDVPTLVKGGEREGLQRLNDYFFQQELVLHYKEKRNGLLSFNDSSKFSAWLADGSLSPRRVYWELKRFEEEVEGNKSTYWLFFELLWRDYFHVLLREKKEVLFAGSGIQQLPVDWEKDQKLFEAWCSGSTGYPLIDASMRQLKAVGYMSNRARQNTAAFLTKNLGIDWRWGAAWFESHLIDYDTASNYGNWQYVAGIGTDAKGFRTFDVVEQGKLFDPEGTFVKYWIPALKHLPAAFIYCPFEMNENSLKAKGVKLGVDYPFPIVSLKTSSEEQRQKYEEARRKQKHVED